MISPTDNNIENRADFRRITLRLPTRIHEALRRRALEEQESEASIVRAALKRELGPRLVETR